MSGKLLILIIAFAVIADIKCDVESTINIVVPKILNKAIDKQVIPSGAYSLFEILETQDLATKEQKNKQALTLDVRNLNNHTKIIIDVVVDTETAEIFDWKYDYCQKTTISKELALDMPFVWLDYAVSVSSKFCQTDPDYYFTAYEEWNFRPFPLKNMEMPTLYQSLSMMSGYADQRRVFSAKATFTSDLVYLSLKYEAIPDYGADEGIGFNILYQPCSGTYIQNIVYL